MRDYPQERRSQLLFDIKQMIWPEYLEQLHGLPQAEHGQFWAKLVDEERILSPDPDKVRTFSTLT
jgi:hypothetical protein